MVEALNDAYLTAFIQIRFRLLNIKILTVTSFWKAVIEINMFMFRFKNYSYRNIYWKYIHCFQLNAIQDTNVVYTGQFFIHFLWGTDWVHNQNMHLLDWVCWLLRKYILPFSFKAVTKLLSSSHNMPYRA